MKIRKYISALLFCVVVAIAKGQTATDIPVIVPPSPDLASLARIGAVSSELFTGSASVRIPLYEISVGDLKLPIALAYSSNGIKVNDIASRVGLGWNLIAGGNISRIVHDEDDLLSTTSHLAPPVDFTISNTNNALYDYLLQANVDDVDTESDEYSYSVNGMSGKFFFDNTGVPREISHNNVKIEKIGTYFILTDVSGNKYYFGDNSQDEKTKGYQVNGVGRWNKQSQTGWFLTKIMSPENQTITFTYDTISIKTLQGASQTVMLKKLGNGSGTDNPCTDCDYIGNTRWQSPLFNQLDYSTRYLKEINSSNGIKVTFTYQSRGDVGGDNRITDIRISGSGNLFLLKNYHLEYLDKVISGDWNKRFYLVKLYELPTDQISLPPVTTDAVIHQFQYNDPDGLPSQKSFNQDYFGYANTANNINFFPKPIDYANYERGSEGANREPYFDNMKKGILTKVIYPTGGFDEFEYEQHTLAEQRYDSSFLSKHLFGVGTTNSTIAVVKSMTFTTNSTGSLKFTLTALQNPAGPFPGQPNYWYPQDNHNLVQAVITKTSTNTIISTTTLFNVYDSRHYTYSLDPNTNYKVELKIYGASTYGSLYSEYNPSVIAYWYNKPVCGLRVKSIRSHDPVANKDVMKYYKYCSLTDLTKSSGVGYSFYDYIEDYPGGGVCAATNCGGSTSGFQVLTTGMIQLSSSSICGSYLFNGASSVAYGTIIECDDPELLNGGIEHTFQTSLNSNFPTMKVGVQPPLGPRVLDVDINGIEMLTRYFKKINNSYPILKIIQNSYSYDNRVYYSVTNYVNRKRWGPLPNIPMWSMADKVQPFDLGEYKFTSEWYHLDNTVVTQYDQDGQNPMVTATSYEYNNTAHLLPTKITTASSASLPITEDRTYPADYSVAPYTAMVTKHILSPVIETKSSKNSVLLTTVKKDFLDWFSNGTVYRPQLIKTKTLGYNEETRLHYYSFATPDNPLELSKENDEHISYIWNNLNAFPIAEVKNAAYAQVAYSSFEGDSYGNWTPTGATITAGGVTGSNKFSGTLSRTVPSGNYTVTLWCSNTAIRVNSLAGTNIRSKGSWTLYSWSLTNVSSVQVVGTDMDEVRLYPENALMKSYTYKPFIGFESETDPNNNIVYYEYDLYNRLVRIRDIDNNIIHQYDYKYLQALPACGSTAANWVAVSPERCVVNLNNNPTGLVQQDQKDMNNCSNTYLQTRVVTVSSPTITCTPVANCTGANKRVVNGACETSFVKVYTSSVFSEGYYLCTYHYEFSDGAWSPDYSQSSSALCLSIL